MFCCGFWYMYVEYGLIRINARNAVLNKYIAYYDLARIIEARRLFFLLCLLYFI
jgi:hypothetical protein